MAGTVTQDLRQVGPYQMIEMAWTSSAGGEANATTDWGVDGAISHIETIPSASAAPTAGYDITLKTIDGRDVARGSLADRSAADAELISVRAPCLGNLTLAVTNAGNAKKGTIRIFFLGNADVTPSAAMGAAVSMGGALPAASGDGQFLIWNATSGEWEDAGGDLTYDGTKIIVPSGTSGAALGLQFGAGGGMWRSGTNLFVTPNASSWLFQDSIFRASNSNRAGVSASRTNLTLPVFLPDYIDPDTGLGSDGEDILSLVAGGKSGVQVDGSGTYTTTTLYSGAASGAIATALKVENAETGADGGGVSISLDGKDALDADVTFATIEGRHTDEAAGEMAVKIGETGYLEVRTDASAFGFNTAATAVQTGYTSFTNLATDRTCDADTVAVAELADILGTLIEDLKAKGIISA